MNRLSSIPIILASASPRRSELLLSLGYRFQVVPSRAEEIHDPKIALADLCALNAERKAREVAESFPECLIIGADTLVGLNGRLFGKPSDLDEAARMLRELSGQTHQVTTGVCLIHRGRREVFTDLTEVTFRPLTDQTIAEYLRAVPVLDKAGAYGIQEKGDWLVETISGSFTNVVGFPTEAFEQRMRSFAVTAE